MEVVESDVIRQIEELRTAVRGMHEVRACGHAQKRGVRRGQPGIAADDRSRGPGQNEDATGRPFVGRAGALLDEALAACRIARQHVFICNIVKCRACVTENGSTRNRPPSTQEIETCTPWLEKQIEIIRPLVILCLGLRRRSSS